MSGIANSLSSAVSPTPVPCKHRTTSRSRPAARRLSRRSNDGASTRRFSGWELRIAESAGVRVAWPAARPGTASVPTVSHTVTHNARRISYNSETRGVETAPVLLLLHFATPSTIVPSRKPRAARGVTCGCLGAYAFRLAPVFREDPLTAYDFRLTAVAGPGWWVTGGGQSSPPPRVGCGPCSAGRGGVAGGCSLRARPSLPGP